MGDALVGLAEGLWQAPPGRVLLCFVFVFRILGFLGFRRAENATCVCSRNLFKQVNVQKHMWKYR